MSETGPLINRNRTPNVGVKSDVDTEHKRKWYKKGSFGYIILISLYIIICLINILYLSSAISEIVVKILSTIAYATAAIAYTVIYFSHKDDEHEKKMAIMNSITFPLDLDEVEVVVDDKKE